MLNAPRTIPYAFRVFEREGWAWLYDESERTYCCSFQPSIYAEPLYPVPPKGCVDPEAYDQDAYDCPPEAGYFGTSRGADPAITGSIAIDLDSEDVAPDVSEHDAWDLAREEANANHRI